MVVLLIIFLGVVALAYLPQMWVRGVIARHSAERADFPGSGSEFARHLLDAMKLGHVAIEVSKEGDHYDPTAKVIRLAPERYGGRSLAAVVIAAHEVGHAMQDATDYKPLKSRTALAKSAARIESFASVIMLAAPVLVLVMKSPVAFFISYLAGALIMSSTIVMHALTLPVEFDASFNRALPLLEEGGYVAGRDRAAARKILRAAAFTYVASAAMSLLNVARWFRVIRF